MDKQRVRVTKSSRSRLNVMKEGDETYSDVLGRVLPKEVDERIESEEKVSIAVNPEIHDRIFAFAGDGVSAYRVVEYYLYREKMKQAVAANDLLDSLYNRGNGLAEERHIENTETENE